MTIAFVDEAVRCEICRTRESTDWYTLYIHVPRGYEGWYFCGGEHLKTWFLTPESELPPAMPTAIEKAKAYLAQKMEPTP